MSAPMEKKPGFKNKSFTPKFWKPGTPAPSERLSEERISNDTSQEGSGSAIIHNPNASLSVEQQRQRLPVFNHRNNILYLLEKYSTVVIVGETGCGKSTQIPQYLLEAGWAAEKWKIGVTQPRRVAVVTVANRVAEERGVILGDEVGYAIRFDDCWDEQKTKIKFMTDGLLVREMMKDPLLSKYSVVMLDEAHERTLHTDIIIGLLKKIQKKREDLRLIVASATLDAEAFCDFFNQNNTKDRSKDTAVIFSIEGRMYPVDVHYSLDPLPNYLTAMVETIVKIHKSEKSGDVLAFLTGQDEVDHVVRLLIEHAKKIPKNEEKMKILPMYGGLPSSEQFKVFERTPRFTRKIVVATNIAEASITINGIVYVVDCGFVKLKAFNAKTGTESLVIVPTSQASAEQRAGRAGRIRSGKAYRLYTESDYETLAANTIPEMQRTSLAPVILQLKALGIDNVLRFSFLSPPPAQNMVRGLELLYALGALDDGARLTSTLGLKMAELPLPPMFSKMLLASGEFGCSEEAITIAAMMQIQNVFFTPSNQKVASNRAKRKFSVEEGDHMTMLNVYNAFIKYKKNAQWCHENYLNFKGLTRATEIRQQLVTLMKRADVPLVSCGDDVTTIRRCITAGFFPNAARLHYTGEYLTVRDEHTLTIHPTSVLYAVDPPKWVVFGEVIQTSKEFMRDITVIESSWLYELAPHFYNFGTDREVAVKRAKLA
ncbi:probable ATP-dependent RNA helicase DHX35 [Lineus longissimus]|uniref:probable ATP-dependent RNA helicase DHX35 n=1 Tax=Lineus longissimus TaxID=88925 RepID=UPI002B4F8E93